MSRELGVLLSQSGKDPESWVDMKVGGLEWSVHRRLTDFVRGCLWPHWSDLSKVSGAQVIKENRVRSVYCIPSSEGEIFVKRFRHKNRPHKLKTLFASSKAKAEWGRARRVYESGVPTAQPAFVGERRASGVVEDCTVGFFKVPGSRDFSPLLDEARALEKGLSDSRREDFAKKLARLTFELFEIGALHYDYHLGNLLLNDRDELFVIDLDAVRFVGSPSKSQKRHVIARMSLSHAPFARRVRPWSRAEVAWYCQHYTDLDASLGRADELFEDVLKRAFRLERIRLQSRDKRCLVHSTLFTNARHKGRRVFRRRSVSLSAIDEGLEAPAIELLHSNARGRVELIQAPAEMAAAVADYRGGEVPKTMVRKTIVHSKFTSRLETLVRESKGMSSWKAARALEVREIPTALTLALVEQPYGFVMKRGGVLFMEHLQGCWMLHEYLKQVLRGGPEDGGEPWSLRWALIRDLAVFLSIVQETGICHRDLAVQNVLVRPREGLAPEIFLIDLDTVRIKALKRKDLLRNLVHFSDLPPAASARDKLRFFFHYWRSGGKELARRELGTTERRKIIMEVEGLLEARMEAKRQRALAKARKQGKDEAS